MKRPLQQRLFYWLIYLLVGYSLAGVFLDATNNAISIISPRLGIIIGAFVLVLWVSTELFLRARSLSWVSSQGHQVRLRALGAKTRLALAGAVGLLLVPWVISWTEDAKKQSPGVEVIKGKEEENPQKKQGQHNEQTPSELTVLIAGFYGPSPQEYGIEHIIFDSLEEAARKYPDLDVKRLGQVIKSNEEALAANLSALCVRPLGAALA